MGKVLITCSVCSENRIISEIRFQQILETIGVRNNKCRSCARKSIPSIQNRSPNYLQKLVCPSCKKIREVSKTYARKIIAEKGNNIVLCHTCANISRKTRTAQNNLSNGYIEVGKCRLYPTNKGRPKECISADWEEKLCEHYQKCNMEVARLDWEGWRCELKENYK